MASPKSRTVSRLVLCSLTVRALSVVTHSDSEGSCREQEGLRFMWQTISLHQGKQSGWMPPVALSFMLHFRIFFFFSLASNCSEFSPWPSFICEKMPSERACRDIVWACVPEEGQQSVCTQRMEKTFLCFRITEHTLSKMNQFLPAGIISTNWENKAINIQSPTTRFQKRPRVLTDSCSFPWPGLSHCFPQGGPRATYIRIVNVKESLLLEKDSVVCDF